jgi:hypothetical protein
MVKSSISLGRSFSSIHFMAPILHWTTYSTKEQGIHHLFIASMFDANFYVASVGMVPGAAHLFCHWVVEELRKVSHSRR